MDREELKKILPHREPMLLLDEAVLVGETAVGKYKVKGDEFFLQGHFPGMPIVPGVIQCEILAQTACVLLKDTVREGQHPLYTGLDKVRFRAPVYPGDTIETACSITRSCGPFYFAKGTVSVGDTVCVSAEFSFAVK